MSDFPWRAGTKFGYGFHAFDSKEAAERWTEQFLNKMYVWHVSEESEND